MSPVIPVYKREEIEEKFGRLLKDPSCEMHSLVQSQCTFDGNNIHCLPFRRVFLRCSNKFRDSKEIVGYKLTPNHNLKRDQSIKKINIEITSQLDNQYDLKSKDVDEFLKADSVLRDKMENYYNKYK